MRIRDGLIIDRDARDRAMNRLAAGSPCGRWDASDLRTPSAHYDAPVLRRCPRHECCSVAGGLRACRNLAQGRDHRDLGPVLRVERGELLLVGHGLLEGVVLHDGPAADDLLGLGVRSVDPADLALTNHEVHGVLSAVQAAAVEEHALGGLFADIGVHRVEQRLRRRADALFHPHESHETRHLDHSFWLLGGLLLEGTSNERQALRHSHSAESKECIHGLSQGWTSPARKANATACARSRTPVLAKSRLTCVLTVASLTTSRAAISPFDSPAAIRVSTSVSRGVSPSTGWADPMAAGVAAGVGATASRWSSRRACTTGSSIA